MQEPDTAVLLKSVHKLDNALAETGLSDLEKVMSAELFLELLNSKLKAKMTALAVQKYAG